MVAPARTMFCSGLLAFFAGTLALSATGICSTVWAESAPASLKKIRTVKTRLLFSEDFFKAAKPDLSGAGFPPGAHTLLKLNPQAGASMVLLAPSKNGTGRISQTPVAIADPINTAFDNVSQGAKGFGLYRLFLLDAKPGKLIAIKAGVKDVMDADKLRRFDLREAGIINPQGMTLDPGSGRLYILDSVGPRLVILTPKPGRDFEGSTVSRINLPSALGALRGIAFNPSNRHLYVASPQQKKLYELKLDGEQVATLDLSGEPFGLPQGMIFAPSLDDTDAATVFHLYVATEGAPYAELSEWALPALF